MLLQSHQAPQQANFGRVRDQPVFPAAEAKFWMCSRPISVGLPCGRSSVRTLAGPTLRELSRKCCPCNYTCKWLDFLVFSDKDVGPVSQLFIVPNPEERRTTHALFEKCRTRSSRCCDLTLLCRSLAKLGLLALMFPKMLV